MRLIDADAINPMRVPQSVKEMRAWIDSQPTVDAVPVRHGKWIGKSTGGEYFDCCSECGYVEWDAPNNFCPCCGARMDEDEID